MPLTLRAKTEPDRHDLEAEMLRLVRKRRDQDPDVLSTDAAIVHAQLDYLLTRWQRV